MNDRSRYTHQWMKWIKKLILLQKIICMRSQKSELRKFDRAVYYLFVCVCKLLIQNNKLPLKYRFLVYKVTHSSFEWWMKWRKTQTQTKSGHIISQIHTRNPSKKQISSGECLHIHQRCRWRIKCDI